MAWRLSLQARMTGLHSYRSREGVSKEEHALTVALATIREVLDHRGVKLGAGRLESRPWSSSQ